VTFVLHTISNDIAEHIQRLDEAMLQFGFPNHAIHTAPLIRREGDYLYLPTVTRKQIFNRLFYFARNAAFTYHTIVVDKRLLSSPSQLEEWLSKRLAAFLYAHLEDFTAFDTIVLYYDNGQMELTGILRSVFNEILNNVTFQKILPANHRLTQVADLLCTLELLALKAERNALSRSELAFFSSSRDLHRHYIDHLRKKHI
jgi:hypothetical protein